MPAGESLRIGGLPLGLAQGVKLRKAKRAGDQVSWADVEIDESQTAVRVRREMEAVFGSEVTDRAA
jgi:predicted homoserine dehydrogenase-like protein